MTRYFTAVITFMVVLSIAMVVFDGFDSRQGIASTVILSLAAAAAAYVLVSKKNEDKEYEALWILARVTYKRGEASRTCGPEFFIPDLATLNSG